MGMGSKYATGLLRLCSLTLSVWAPGDRLARSGAGLSKSLLSDTEVLPRSHRPMHSPSTVPQRVSPPFLEEERGERSKVRTG